MFVSTLLASTPANATATAQHGPIPPQSVRESFERKANETTATAGK